MPDKYPNIHDGYVAVKAADVTDLALLPKRFDALAARVDAGFDLLGNKIMQAITRIDERLADHSAELALHDARLAKLEALFPKVRKRVRRRGKSKRK